MEIITLVENSCADGRLRQEFGLSLLVRCAAGSILFDMGASRLFTDNARAMGIDLADVDCAVLSHAHYDHGGGLGTFLALNDGAEVYVGRRAAGRAVVLQHVPPSPAGGRGGPDYDQRQAPGVPP